MTIGVAHGHDKFFLLHMDESCSTHRSRCLAGSVLLRRPARLFHAKCWRGTQLLPVDFAAMNPRYRTAGTPELRRSSRRMYTGCFYWERLPDKSVPIQYSRNRCLPRLVSGAMPELLARRAIHGLLMCYAMRGLSRRVSRVLLPGGVEPDWVPTHRCSEFRCKDSHCPTFFGLY
jgi:hypothetical protein